MDIETLVIETRGDNGKEKLLRASLLHVISFPALMSYTERSPNLPVRPAMLSFAAPDNECRAFAAAARSGKVMEGLNQAGTRECDLELLKSDGYRAAISRMSSGATAITLLSPKVFELDARPGDEVGFGMAVPTHWVDSMAKSLTSSPGLSKLPLREVAVAMWFVAYLDRRVRTPLLATSEFAWILWRSALAQKLAVPAATGDRRKGSAWVNPSAPIGLEVVASVYAPDPDAVESWIARETRSYMNKGGRAVVDDMLREAAERVRLQEESLFAAQAAEEEEERQAALIRATKPERTGARGDGSGGASDASEAGRRGGVPRPDEVRDQLGLFGEVAL